MRVALLTREFPPEVYGGAGVHVDHLSRELSTLVDVEVHCFGEPRPSPLVAAAYAAQSVPGDVAGILATLAVDIRMAGGVEGVDLAHSHTWYANFAGHLAKTLHGIPHVMTTHSLEPSRPWKAEQLGRGYAVSGWCEETAIASADAVVAVSAAMRDEILAAYPSVDANRIAVIHNGIDAEAYQPRPAPEVLHRFGIDARRPYALFVGRITRQKGLALLLEAAPMLERSAQLVLCAGAPDTREIAHEVRSQVDAARDSGATIIWIEEMLDLATLVPLLTQAGVFVCPSVYEPFGLINLEAMACETAVVATAVGGIPEVVVDSETGYLVEAEAASMAGRVNELLADAELARRFGEAGRARVLERFSWTTIAVRTVELYASLLG